MKYNTMTPDKILQSGKYWRLTKPKSSYSSKDYSDVADEKVIQQKFYDEYHPSGHKIYDPLWHKDIPKIKKVGGVDTISGYHYVARESLSIQKDSITIVLAHLLGNHTKFVDSTVGENKSDVISQYKEFWDQKNMEVARYEFIKSVLAVGDGAILFYRDPDSKTLGHKVFSYLNKDVIYAVNDKFGELAYFARFYSMVDENGEELQMCDVVDKANYTTYTNKEGKWEVKDSVLHGFKSIPVVYQYRRTGAFWSHVQTNIDNLEKKLSMISEDNRKKAKSRYHLKTTDANTVQMVSSGESDIVITDEVGDFKMIEGADISGQFKFEWDTSVEMIYNSLGIVYPKSKSSGDMPTGSMKMMFFPTERVVFELIQDFNPTIDKVNQLFKEGMIFEHPELSTELTKLNVTASIKMFTPQDESSWNTMVGQAKAQGIVSTQTASESCTISSNDEFKRIESEQAKEQAARQVEINPLNQ